MAPASRLWLRNCSPSVAEICSLESSWIGNGSEPNLRTVTISLASLTGKPPIEPAVIWTWPLGIELLMDGAVMTAPSSVTAKNLPMFSAVCLANSCAPEFGPSFLRTKSTDRPPLGSRPTVADWIWSPPNNGGNWVRSRT